MANILIEVEETKKAKQIISCFSNREFELYKYSLQLLDSDINHILKCENELKFTETPEKYHKAISNQMKMSDRICYMMQNLDLYISCNFEQKKIIVKILKDK